MKIARHGAGLVRPLLLGLGALVALMLAPPRAMAAFHEILLSSFCTGTGCTEGNTPFAGLLRDPAGNFYGTTSGGGTAGGGAVFELSPNATGTGWTQKTLYNFCRQPDCADGQTPLGSLIMDAAGRLYGTTSFGGSGLGFAGAVGGGTVFELTPNAARTAWTETVLYSFCPQTNCVDGYAPSGSLITDRSGHLYGTTDRGGSGTVDGGGGCGTVFELTPNAQRTTWTETVLYSFCTQANCVDGFGPQAGLVVDPAGNFYSTAAGGGAANSGAVFQLTPDKSGTHWTETVLYSFCVQPACPGSGTGVGPLGSLIADAAGNLYGTTAGGGSAGGGLVFELTPNAARTSWTGKTLYNFCVQAGCIDGARPAAALLMDGSGNLFGTTSQGGVNADHNDDDGNGGTFFELTPNAARTAWTETVLHSFCTEYYCSDGNSPLSTLIMDPSGNLYGTNALTRDGNGGSIFEFEKVP